MTVTLKEVAIRAGVSRSAVSRTFTDGASVSAKTRAKVEKAAVELGYSPNALASSLTTGRTKLIGLVSNNFHNPLFLEVFDLFTRGLQDRGLRPLLVNLSDETDPANSLRMLRQYSVDGVIVVSSTLPTRFSRAFHEAGLPVVHCFARTTGAPEVHVTGIDDIAAGALAARTLRDRGYGRLGFLGGPPGTSATRDREAGFRRIAGPDAPAIHAAAYSHAAGRAALISSGLLDRVDGWFGADDILSIGALSALRASGLRVPRDVGLIGVNDLDMAGWPEIGLSTLHMPLPQIIAAAIDQITALMQDPARLPEARLFGVHLVERETLREAGSGSGGQ